MLHLVFYSRYSPAIPEVPLRLYLASILLCVCTSASAYTNIDTARRAYAAIPFSNIYANKDQRSEMAVAIQAYWQDFDNRLPRLSLNELEWLKSELDTTDNARLSRAVQTREFSLWELASISDQCTNAVAGLVIAINTPAQEQTEMFHWSKVANCYHQSNGSLFRHLRGARLDTNDDANDGHTLDSLMLSRILLVIIPSSIADTMGWELNSE